MAMKNRILLVDRMIPINQSMINENTEMIEYNKSDPLQIIEQKINEFANNHQIESFGFVFHGSSRNVSLASDCNFFTIPSIDIQPDAKIGENAKSANTKSINDNANVTNSKDFRSEDHEVRRATKRAEREAKRAEHDAKRAIIRAENEARRVANNARRVVNNARRMANDSRRVANNLKPTDDERLTGIFKRLVDNNGLKNIDFLACNLASHQIWNQYFDILRSKLNVTIGASLNKTGNVANGGDWLLEISGRNSKTIYFNNNVSKLKILFAAGYTVVGNPSDVTFFDTTTLLSGSTRTLTGDVMIVLDNATNPYIPIVIDMGGVYDGANHTVKIKLADSYADQIPYMFDGLFRVIRGTVKNLAVNIELNSNLPGLIASDQIILNNNAGWINTPDQLPATNSCTIINCKSNGNIDGDDSGCIVGSCAGYGGKCTISDCTSTGDIYGSNSGGIVGSNAGWMGLCTVTNCTSYGKIGGSWSGGIVGRGAGAEGVCTVTKCTSSGEIDAEESGGIVGGNAGEENGQCTVTDCTSHGNINDDNSGGIVGYEAGYRGVCNVANCTSHGNIIGEDSGGIVAENAGYRGSCTITNCKSHGNIIGDDAGGIIGRDAGYGGMCSVANCTSSGDIIGDNAGGIVGSEAGSGEEEYDGNNYVFYPGECNVTNCASSGDIVGDDAGGIAGDEAGYNYGECNITNCTSFGDIIGDEAGGIVGDDAGYEYGECNVINCTTSGDIIGDGSGGITGDDPGSKNGECNVTNCTSSGDIVGEEAGGIVGEDAGYENGECNVTNCTSSGNIVGRDSGGIAGSWAGNQGVCTIAKCMATGTVSNNTPNGSIVGSYASDDSGTVTIENCYYKTRLYGVRDTATGTLISTDNYESNCNNMRGILMYTNYPDLGNEYYNIHAVGIADTSINYGLKIVKVEMTANNLHPLAGNPVPENMAIAYATNSGKIGTVQKFTLTTIPTNISGTKFRFCIPNADTTKTFGVYDINNVRIGNLLANDVEGSNTFDFTFPSGYVGKMTCGVYVFFVRNTMLNCTHSGGDPHIVTLSGERYKLDKNIREVTLLKDTKNDITIIGICAILYESDFKKHIYSKDRYVETRKLNFLQDNTYFRGFIFKCGDDEIRINADSLNTKIIKNITNKIQYKYTDNNTIYSLIHNKAYPMTDQTKTMEIWLDKRVQMIITSDVNTDERHYIKLSLYDCQKDKMTGAFIKNSNENVIKRSINERTNR
jgi:hypothetical protein